MHVVRGRVYPSPWFKGRPNGHYPFFGARLIVDSFKSGDVSGGSQRWDSYLVFVSGILQTWGKFELLPPQLASRLDRDLGTTFHVSQNAVGPLALLAFPSSLQKAMDEAAMMVNRP